MPRGIYKRKTRAIVKTGSRDGNPFLPETVDLNKSYAYYKTQFESGMSEVMSAVKKVSLAMTRMEALHQVAFETTPEPNSGKTKNCHQIQKICPHCREPNDPRGFARHVVACERKKYAAKR